MGENSVRRFFFFSGIKVTFVLLLILPTRWSIFQVQFGLGVPPGVAQGCEWPPPYYYLFWKPLFGIVIFSSLYTELVEKNIPTITS